jgi:hypothetical protein
MLYRSHVAFGIGAGALIAGAAHAAGFTRSPEATAAVFGLTAAFSLLPDLDTASVVQRWFYRLLFAVLVAMMAAGRSAEAAFIGTASLLPLLQWHRGWMHRPWAAGVVPVGALILWGVYWQSLRPDDVLTGRILDFAFAGVLLHNGIYLLAMVSGYLVHLAVDFLISPAVSRRRVR